MFEFVVSLADKVSGPAKQASGGIMGLQKNLATASKDMATYQKQLGLAKQLGDVEGYRKFSSLVTDQRRKVYDLQNQVGSAGTEFNNLGSAMGKLSGTAMLVGGAVVGVYTAVQGLIAAGVNLAIEQNELKTRLLSTFTAMAGGPEAGKKTLDMLEDLSQKLPQTKEMLGDWTKAYMAMGITDISSLREQITATASAAALMRDGGAEAFTTLSKKIMVAVETGQGLKIPIKGLGALANMGVQVSEVAAKMGVSTESLAAQLKAGTANATDFGTALRETLIEKGAGPLATMGKELTTQWTKFKESIAGMFRDVNVTPFLDALNTTFSLFKEGAPLAKTMKWAITEFFDAVLGSRAKAIPMLTHWMLQLVIVALKTYIAFKQPSETMKMWIGVLQHAWVAVKAIAIVLGVLAVAVGAYLYGPMLLGIAGCAALVVALGYIPDAVAWVIEKVVELGTWIGKVFSGGWKIASDFVSGLVDGIVGGVTRVVDAAKNLGSSAVTALKDVLGIHSPSAVMAQMGDYSAQGFAKGMSGGLGDVSGSASDMGDAAAGGAKGSRNGAGMTINVGGIHIEGGTKGALELTEEAVSLLFERVMLAQGL